VIGLVEIGNVVGEAVGAGMVISCGEGGGGSDRGEKKEI
jgi:hypothetical protein